MENNKRLIVFRVCTFSLCLLLPLFFIFSPFRSAGAASPEFRRILDQVEKSYAGIAAYRCLVRVYHFEDGKPVATKVFWYSFRKPNLLRLDFKTPQTGMIVVFPDPEGKVAIHPPGLFSLFQFHLAEDNPLLRVSAGQSITQTSLGLLIENMGRSIGEDAIGAPEVISEDRDSVVFQVLAKDHFQPGVNTRYRLRIDKRLWLPDMVEESSPEGIPTRKIRFEELRTDIFMPDDFFNTASPAPFPENRER